MPYDQCFAKLVRFVAYVVELSILFNRSTYTKKQYATHRKVITMSLISTSSKGRLWHCHFVNCAYICFIDLSLESKVAAIVTN